MESNREYILNNTYKLTNKLGSGAFGDIYNAINLVKILYTLE